MRLFSTALSVSVLAAGCGGGKGGSRCPPPQAPVGTLAGTGALGGGATFQPAEMDALVVHPTTCTVGGRQVYVAGIFLGFPSFQGICASLEGHGFCFETASATVASVQVVHGGLQSAQAVPGPGTYPVTVGIPTPDADGNFTIAGASYARTDAGCATLASSDAASGSVVFDSLSSTELAGSMDVTFSDGSRLAGSFTAVVASLGVDVCQLFAGTCAMPACLP